MRGSLKHKGKAPCRHCKAAPGTFHLVSCSKIGVIATDLLSKVTMEKQAPIPDEATLEAIGQHKALALLEDRGKLEGFLKLTLLEHALKDAELGRGEGKDAAAARKRFADVAGKLSEEED